MEKTRLIAQIIDQLKESLEVLETAAKASHAEATHESSKAENKYDTRGLEAAYLAGGQARQARAIIDSINAYAKLPLKTFGPDDEIDLSALVELEVDGIRSLFFIGPRHGGLELTHQRKEVTVITPESPLGQQLAGRKSGQRWTAEIGGRVVKYFLASVV